MTAKKMTGRVLFKENLVGDIWLVRLGFDEIQEFVAGQYASLKVDDRGLRRSYSVASLPGEKHIDLLVDVSPMGVGSKYILSLKLDDQVEVLAYLGRFVVEDQGLRRDRRVIFVATGTGIAPERPMIEDLLDKKHFDGQVRLYWGMRHEADVYWQEELERIARDHSNFKFSLVLSKPDEDWLGLKGHVGEVIEANEENWGGCAFYLCGRKEMVEEMVERAEGHKVPPEMVIFERFD